MRLTVGLLVPLVCSAAMARAPSPRTLSFVDRVNAQAAIERVYYTRQLGATKPFDAAMPRAVVEGKVRKYLEQSAALTAYWKSPVTDAALDRELQRMAAGSRMPERLLELYGALHDDPFLIKECLARPVLVDRLSRNFYAFDAKLHAGARQRAEELHRELLSGELDASMPQANRTVRDVVRKESAFALARAGQTSQVKESREAFTFDVVLSETPTSVRVASYLVPKTTWDAWWVDARRTVRAETVAAVASSRSGVPRPSGAAGCSAVDTWDNGTLGELPEERSGHSAIWTGSVMVVWGGDGDNGVLNTGGRYDPATDSWTSVSTAGAPSPRFRHTAVWSGRVMIVWGGRGLGGTILDTGGRYDPVADSWAETSTREAPTARVAHTAVWTGKEMIVWGGFGGADLDDGALYDPDADAWAPTASKDAPRARHGHVAVWAGDQMLIWGSDGDSETRTTGSRYTPATDSWKAISPIGVPEELTSGYTAVWTGQVMVIWGTKDFSVGAKYDPIANTWTSTSTDGSPGRRVFHTAVWTGTRMVVWGGEGSRGRSISTGGSYDPVTDEWSPTSDERVPSARAEHTAVWTGSQMLVWGGYGQYETNGDPPTRFNTGGRYDPAADSWTPTSTNGAPSAQRGHTAVWTGTQMVVWGGNLPDRVPHNVNLGARYDPAIDSWSPTTTSGAPEAREHHTAVWTGTQMLVWGGFSDEVPFVGGGSYDPTTDSWKNISTTGAPSLRSGHTAVWTGSVMVVWGGFDFPDHLKTGGRYDPVADGWTPTSTTDAPTGRERHTAVWTGTEMIVWGGESDDGFLESGGRYDPQTDSWTPTSQEGAPEPNVDHTAVWTGNLMLVWGGFTDDPGRYDPSTDTWSALSRRDAPSERREHSAIWTGREMVVWGGDGDQERLDTGGRYDPAADSWTPTSTTKTPSARRGHTAVWTGDLMLVWGGDSLIDVDRIGRYVLGGSVDNDGDGFTECEGDCDDTNAAVHPGAAEICNGIDDDCDGVTDNGGNALCDDANACTTDRCDATAGCAHPNRPNGTVCDDGSSCTTGDTCQSGACTPSFSSLLHPEPKSAAYYQLLCTKRVLGIRPYLGDQLTDDDAACVGRTTSTFAGLTTAAELCGVIAVNRRPAAGGSTFATACTAGDDELIATALNICRARVCGAQQLDSLCHGRTHTTVTESFVEADAILDDAAGDRSACARATCELREINNGDPRRRPMPPTVRARRRR